MAYKLQTEKKVAVISMLAEGSSIRAIERITGVNRNTIMSLALRIGTACKAIMDEKMRNLPCERLQADEAWSFCYAKAKNVKPEHFENGGYAGDAWTFVAIDADSKLVISWLTGRRDAGFAADFLRDVEGRLANRVQLTTDGHKMDLHAVPSAFGNDVDYAQLVKVYGNDPEGQKRYSPAQCLGTEKKSVIGEPDARFISTSWP